MGYVREPDGIDFIINGKPLTEKQKNEISAFIKANKESLVKLESSESKARTGKKVVTNGKLL